MELASVVIFYLFVESALAKMNQIRLARHSPLKDKNITAAVVSKSKRIVAAECARPCVDLHTYESFFFNTATGECQYHDVVFTSSAWATNQEDMEYYYIIKGRNNWCPMEKGFELLTEDGPCVKFHTDKKTWYEANETCTSYSPYSHLVVLDNEEKNELVKAAGLAIQDQFNTGVWIGLCEYAQDTYRWVSGQDVNFTDWGSLDDSHITGEDCGAHNRGDGWRWAKAPCARQYHCICEVDVDIKQYHKMMDNN